MNSIRRKFLRAVFLIIAVLSVTCVGFFILHLVVVENYKSISDNMIDEYRLMDLTSNLITAYNSRSRNASVRDLQAEQSIKDVNTQIDLLIEHLDTTITNKESQVHYIGMKNTVASVKTNVNDGLHAMESGTISNISSYYEAANKNYEFVKANGTQLILQELQYANSIQQVISNSYRFSTIAGALVLFITSLGCIVYIVSFSKKFVDPIQTLKKTAEQIAQGNMDVQIDQALLKRDDEIGSLSNSYNIMIHKLVAIISKQTEASESLSSKNLELERLNKLMVGRELKMSELKREIEILQGHPVDVES